MGVAWTSEQLEAIYARDCNLLVAAAAGSGKTAVLVERIIGRVLDEDNPVDIDRLLVVTFTKAAASEMKERISSAIATRIDEVSSKSDRTQYQWLKRQLALINKASITTIHSFCQSVIKTYYQKINIDPAFKVADETQIEIIKSDILDELLDELYEEKAEDEVFGDLVDCYGGGRTDEGLKKLILNISRFISSNPFPEKWLSEQVEKFNFSRREEKEELDFSETEWGRIILENLRISVEALVVKLSKAVELARGEDLEGYYDALVGDSNRLAGLKNLCEQGVWDEIYDCLSTYSFDRLTGGRKADAETKDAIKKIRSEVKKTIEDYQKKIVNQRSKDIVQGLADMYPMLSELVSIVLEFNKRYQEHKKEKLIIDFNDMEHYALEILADIDEEGKITPSTAALSYQEFYEEVYVDEYQDSNLTQEIILSLVSRGDNMFMVGDIKQSIYGFRQARPDIFLVKYQEYPEEKGGSKRLVRLYKNFRSRENVIGSVNYIFSRMMSKAAGEIEYSRDEYLNYGADYPAANDNAACELIIGDTVDLEPDEQTDADDDNMMGEIGGEVPGSVQFEAILIANRIKELVYGNAGTGQEPLKVFDKKSGEYRNVKFSDIVILMRSTKKNGETFVEELTAREVPVFWDTSSGFFMTKEVELIMSLLRIIDNPSQDIPLIAVMRSVVGGFSDEDLIDLRLVDRKNDFYNNLKTVAESEDEDSDFQKKCGVFFNKLNKWRAFSYEMTTPDLIWRLYEETGYYDLVGMLENGEKKKANLRMLFDYAIKFEETGIIGLFNFINYVDKIRDSGDVGGATVLGENDNVVRIMSIHKSKGLEFPVVILCDCSKRFNTQDMNQKIILHQTMGLGPDYIDSQLRIIYSTKAKKAIQLKYQSESIAEEMRLLYVAMTRAKEKLILTGTMKNAPQKIAGMWDCIQDGKLSTFNAINASSYFDWVLPILLRHPDMSDMRRTAEVPWNGGILMPKDGQQCQWEFKYKTLNQTLTEDYVDLAPELEAVDEVLEDPFEKFSKDEIVANDDVEYKSYEEEISKRLNWQYPYEEDTKLPVKITVSELKRLKEPDDSGSQRLYTYIPELITTPNFLSLEKKATAMQKGSATHYVLQHIDLNTVRSALEKNSQTELVNTVKDQIMQLVDRRMITSDEASWVNPMIVANFFESDIAGRMLRSNSIKREVPFTMNIKAKDVYPDYDDKADEQIAIQGIIDCFFIENGKIVVIDYKTDRVSGVEMNERAKEYGIQIKTYAEAIERGTGLEVSNAYIYFLNAKDYVKVEVESS